MKNTTIWISVAAALACSSVAQAADGTVNFTGSIVTPACTIDTRSASQSISLGTITASTFGDSTGVAVAPARFTLELNACPKSLTKASIKFDGVADSLNNDLLALNNDSTAAGVGIGIYEANGRTLIPLHTPSAPFDLSSGSATVAYVAKYVSTSASVGVGNADSVTQFTIAYN